MLVDIRVGLPRVDNPTLRQRLTLALLDRAEIAHRLIVTRFHLTKRAPLNVIAVERLAVLTTLAHSRKDETTINSNFRMGNECDPHLSMRSCKQTGIRREFELCPISDLDDTHATVTSAEPDPREIVKKMLIHPFKRRRISSIDHRLSELIETLLATGARTQGQAGT